MKCSICKKDVEPGGAYSPFCSERCRTIDLGNWAAEKYRISAPLEPESGTGDQSGDDEDRDNGARRRQ